MSKAKRVAKKKTPQPSRVNYWLEWDIIGLADAVNAGYNSSSLDFFIKHFKGNCVPLFYDKNGVNRPSKWRDWSSDIVVKAIATDGTEHTITFNYKPDGKVSLSQFMAGITEGWLAACDEQIPDTDCSSAIARAECTAPFYYHYNYAKHQKQPKRKMKAVYEDGQLNAIADGRAGQAKIKVNMDDL